MSDATAVRERTMEKTLPVFGGPCDGGEMPAWGPMIFRTERGERAYWYERHAHRWVLISVTDSKAPHPHNKAAT